MATLLSIVQEILNDMSGDQVNSINDTVESEQVASIVRSTYNAMMSNRNWPHTKRSLVISALGDTAKPTHATLDENVKELLTVFYNKVKQGDTRKLYEEVKYKDSDSFLRYVNARNSDADNVIVVEDASGIELLIIDDAAPTYFTSFDDTTLIFDSYDSEVDNTLQESKFQAQGYIFPDFDLTDDFEPDLPVEAVQALIEGAKSASQLKIRQMTDNKAEQESQRQNRWLSRKAWRVRGGIVFPDYGRKR